MRPTRILGVIQSLDVLNLLIEIIRHSTLRVRPIGNVCSSGDRQRTNVVESSGSSLRSFHPGFTFEEFLQ